MKKRIMGNEGQFNIVIDDGLHRFVMWFEHRKRKKAISNIRVEMLLFGYDISYMTDEDIEKGIMQFANLISNSGVKAKEAGEALRKMMQNLS